MKKYRIEEEQPIISKTGIEFFHFTLQKGKNGVSPHIHSAVELLFIQKGNFQIFVDGEELWVGEGCTVLFRSNTIHRIYCQSEGVGEYYVLKFSPALIVGLSDPEYRNAYLLHLALNTKHEKSVWSAEESARAGFGQALDFLVREEQSQLPGGDVARKIGAAAVLLSLIRELEPAAEPSADQKEVADATVRRIYDVTVYVNSHYSEPITASQCAAMAYMSDSYFSRCFQRVTGHSFKQYLNLVRVRQAEKAILGSDRSVTEIAGECGFGSVSYFISTYKKFKGITPLALRNGKHRNGALED